MLSLGLSFSVGWLVDWLVGVFLLHTSPSVFLGWPVLTLKASDVKKPLFL